MEKDNWTIIDKKTQIASLALLIVGTIAAASIFISLLLNYCSWTTIVTIALIISLSILVFLIGFILAKKSLANKKTKIIICLIIIFIVIIGSFTLYFTNPWLFEKCTCLEDGTKVCGDTELIKIVNYTIYTTAETDFTYNNLGKGFVHNDEATNYYVRVNFSTDNAVGEKKFIVNFLDNDNTYLDSSWLNLKGLVAITRTVVFTISKDSMGDNFEKVEKVSFRISDSLESEKNYCRGMTESYYHDERFFGTWINESGEINESCTSLFTEYTFYSNGTGMTTFGKIYWKTVVYHYRNENIGLDMESYDFGGTPYKYSYYRVCPESEFSNNNNTLWLRAFDEDLYNRIPEGRIQWWCWTTMFYTKQ